MGVFQKYISVPKNSTGIYEYDIGVQGSENLLFLSLPKEEFDYLVDNQVFEYLNEKGNLMIDDYESEIVSYEILKKETQIWNKIKDITPTFVYAIEEAITYKTCIGLDF